MNLIKISIYVYRYQNSQPHSIKETGKISEDNSDEKNRCDSANDKAKDTTTKYNEKQQWND